MNANEIKLGEVYIIKVSGKLSRVKIHSKSRFGGWEGRNVDTGRQVRIKSSARVRYPALHPEPTVDSEPVLVDSAPESASEIVTDPKTFPEIVTDIHTGQFGTVEPTREPSAEPEKSHRRKIELDESIDWVAAGERWMAGESQLVIAESLGVKVSTLDRITTKLGYTKARKIELGYRRTAYKPGQAAYVPA
jgi:hypothetical protein